MKLSIIFLAVTVNLYSKAVSQNRKVTGKAILTDFYQVPYAEIFNKDTLLLGQTKADGSFSIEVPVETRTLLITYIGLEWKRVEISDSCAHLEIILQNAATYDFMSAGKVERRRRRAFDKLQAIHKKAFEKGIFTREKACFRDIFKSTKADLKRIARMRRERAAN